MSQSVRYQHPGVRSHLASQYVLGAQTALVRRRTERLIKADPALEEEVYFWQNRLGEINSALPPATPPDQVWQGISKELAADLDSRAVNSSPRFMDKLALWRIAAAALSVMLLISVFVPREPAQHIIGADYVALLDSADLDSDPELIVAVYLSRGDRPSRLEFDWNDRSARTDIEGMNLLAIDKDTSLVTDLGPIQNTGSGMQLSKPQWAALKNSSELVIATGKSVEEGAVYRGPCIQIARAG